MSFDILTDGQRILKAKDDDLTEFMAEGYDLRVQHFGHNLYCYGPTSYPHNIPSHKQDNPDNFISLSVTGTSCSLDCEHCKSRLLVGMEPTIRPEDMIERLSRVKEKGGRGVLISGGSDSTGHVPLLRFADAIRFAKVDLGLDVVVHTGLVNPETASMLADVGVDAAMFDIIGDDEVARNVYHLENGLDNMRESLRLLHDAGIPVVPHVMVGLYYGRIRGEIEALDMISEFSPEAVVIIALSPLRKTPMEGVAPPSPESIGRVLTIARIGLPETPVLLGCARPLGRHKIETDIFAINSGVNGIAYISEEGVSHARDRGLTPVFYDVCCSLAYRHVR